MKGKAEARRVVEKPVAFKTEADLVNACEWCEQRQVELGQRVKIFPETFNPRIRAQRMMALLWASQVKQDENGVCDSPYLQVLESRCRSHVKSQVEDYSSTLHVATIAVDAAEQLCASVGGEVARSEEAAKQEPEVDLSATDGLSEADRSAVASHDSDVVREQALSHRRWSHKRAGLNRPYVLPGVLEKLPDIELSELAELADEGSAGDADVGAARAVAGRGPCDANEAGCAVGWADAGGVAGEKAGDVVSEFALGGAGAGDARVVGGCGVDGGCACEFAGAMHAGEGAGAGKLGSAGDAADVAVAVADAAGGAGVSVDAREEGVR